MTTQHRFLSVVALSLALCGNDAISEEIPTSNQDAENDEERFEPFLGYPDDHELTPFTFDRGSVLVPYLNKKYQDPAALRDISDMLKEGHLVVLENAFDEAFAERMHEELWMIGEDVWELNEEYIDDGFQFHHHNVYEFKDMPPFVQDTARLFASDETKEFAHVMSGRDTFGDSTPAPSWYAPKDYSMPHSDYWDQRTVAFVWHLSKNWKSEWGGALYWCHERANFAYVPSSFNTLFLFDVRAETTHFVTTVSPHCQGKRLAFNGWWGASYAPSLDDEGLTKYLSSWKNRGNLTALQFDTLMNYLEEIEEEHNGEDPPGHKGLHHALQLVEMEMESRPEATAFFGAEPYRLDPLSRLDSEVEEL